MTFDLGHGGRVSVLKRPDGAEEAASSPTGETRWGRLSTGRRMGRLMKRRLMEWWVDEDGRSPVLLQQSDTSQIGSTRAANGLASRGAANWPRRSDLWPVRSAAPSPQDRTALDLHGVIVIIWHPVTSRPLRLRHPPGNERAPEVWEDRLLWLYRSLCSCIKAAFSLLTTRGRLLWLYRSICFSCSRAPFE